MAVYSKLMLSSGGGIISRDQQADQVKNTATVLIGLGGTGIDALRTIKTQVYGRLKPDDPDAVTPEYTHIRFLGVDTAERSRGDQKKEEEQDNLKDSRILALDEATEFFPISNPDVKKALSNEKALAKRSELNWLRWKEIDKPNLSLAGAGGIRQVGRFMMMDRAQAFITRVEEEINKAKTDLDAPTVNVHIFSGLSGGTGAGCFLDVCYLVRSIANEIGGITVFGYFFLPDVNLSCIPTSNTRVRQYIPRNGYAAMQELDYCMNLPHNGGSFTQEYQGHNLVQWAEPPVDMCHLICATNSDGGVISNAYRYAMSVTAEYLMDFLTDSHEQFGLEEQFANFLQMVAGGDGEKTSGFKLAYCVIGAACASIPLREINTYLASHLFEHFGSIRKNIPTQGDVEALAVQALARDAQSIGGIYESLLRELRENAGDDYAAYQDDWKFVRDYGNSELVTSYTNQTAAKLNRVEANARSMMTAENKGSLLGRLQTQLALVMRDIRRGPIFAQKMFDAAQDHNLLNLIDGLIRENESRWNQEAAQTDLRNRNYEDAKSDFDNRRKHGILGLGDSDAKRFNNYEYYLMLLEQHKLAMNIYDQMNTVLVTLRKQAEDVNGSYYAKLSRVMSNLIDTFQENRAALESEKILDNKDSFSMSMMTVADLKDTLDAEVRKLNIPNMMDAFMALLLNNEREWITEDENKITRLVTHFFVKTAFADFAGRTITTFLKDKYNIENDEQLAERVYQDWMRPLAAKAKPLFFLNSSIWKQTQTSSLAFISVPRSSAAISAAAAKMANNPGHDWQEKESALTDRIYVMSSACVLPLSAYNNCQKYEQAYFSEYDAVGRHYYEGKPVEGMEFDDWRKLPSLTPQSLLDLSTAAPKMKEITESAKALYEKAVALDLVDRGSFLCEPTREGKDKWEALIERCHAAAEKVGTPEDAVAARALLGELAAAAKLPMQRTLYAMKNDGHAGNEQEKRDVQEDHFVSAPVYQLMVRKTLNELEQLRTKSDSAAKALQDAIDRAEKGTQAMNAYCDALFTGVLSLEGRVLLYRESQYGVTSETVLSKRDEAFPFGTIPVYQGFLSYQALPEELRAAMTQKANDRLNADAPEIRETCGKLREALRDDQVNAWAQLAASFPQRSEIVAFLGTLKQRFQIFCLENAVN